MSTRLDILLVLRLDLHSLPPALPRVYGNLSEAGLGIANNSLVSVHMTDGAQRYYVCVRDMTKNLAIMADVECLHDRSISASCFVWCY
jgi:hypothetical protein